MTVLADIVLVTIGVIAVLVVLDAVLRTFVLPRERSCCSPASRSVRCAECCGSSPVKVAATKRATG